MLGGVILISVLVNNPCTISYVRKLGLRKNIWNQFKTRFGIQRIVEFYGATEGNATVGKFLEVCILRDNYHIQCKKRGP